MQRFLFSSIWKKLKIIGAVAIIFLTSSPLVIHAIEHKEQFRLEEELLLLGEEFVITATKTKKKISQAPAMVTVITDKEMKDMGARTWVDVLNTVPGFEFVRGHHGNQILGVRGISTQKTNKIKVMLDGHTINEPLSGSAFHYNFSEMPVDFIKRIEIIRGPGSALYGENAFTAVINIITKKAEDVDGVILEAGGGSFDTQNYNVLAGKKLGDFKFSAYADYYKSHGADLRIEEDSIGRSGYTDDWIERFYSNINASYKDIDFQYFIMNKNSGANLPPSYVVTDESYLDITQMFAEFRYERRITEDFYIKPRLYFDLFDFEFNVEAYPEMLERFNTKNITLGGEIELHYSLFKENELLGGFQYQYYYFYDTTHHANFDPRIDPPLIGDFQDISDEANFMEPDFDDHLGAFYLQDQWTVYDNIFLTAGIRYDHYDRFGEEFSPRFSLVWSPLNDLHLKFLYGEAFRAPDVLELTSRNNLVSKGNLDIDPEKIRTYEVGLKYDPTKYFQGEINLFYNEIDDIIRLEPQTSPLKPRRYINDGNNKIPGVEVAIKSEHSKDTYIMANYSYADPEDEDGRDVPYVSKHKLNLVLNTYLWKYLNGNVTFSFRGNKERCELDSRDEAPSYYLVNLNLLAHDFYPNLEISASVHNLFDKEYTDPVCAKFKLANDLPREGRSFLFFVRYKF